jgi:hypothetical protein
MTYFKLLSEHLPGVTEENKGSKIAYLWVYNETGTSLMGLYIGYKIPMQSII